MARREGGPSSGVEYIGGKGSLVLLPGTELWSGPGRTMGRDNLIRVELGVPVIARRLAFSRTEQDHTVVIVVPDQLAPQERMIINSLGLDPQGQEYTGELRRLLRLRNEWHVEGPYHFHEFSGVRRILPTYDFTQPPLF